VVVEEPKLERMSVRTMPEQAQQAPPVDEGAQVVDEAAVGLVDLVAVLVDQASRVGGRQVLSGGHGRLRRGREG
jgi:hypothetical protein